MESADEEHKVKRPREIVAKDACIENTRLDLRGDVAFVGLRCEKSRSTNRVSQSYIPNVLALPCDRVRQLSSERRFKCRVTDPTAKSLGSLLRNSTLENQTSSIYHLLLDALVSDNNICALQLPVHQYAFLSEEVDLSTIAINFPDTVTGGMISGKNKKGAKNVLAGDVIAELDLSWKCSKNSSIVAVKVKLLTPIQGRVLELNDGLKSEFAGRIFQYGATETYIAILQSDVPDLLINTKDTENMAVAKKNGICFAWTKGQCKRGEACKFLHPVASIINQVDENTK